jgi:hypothetical protein
MLGARMLACWLAVTRDAYIAAAHHTIMYDVWSKGKQ